MDVLMLANQQELIYISSVQTQDVVWKTCLEQWMIRTDGERVREMCAISVIEDDDENLFLNQFHCSFLFSKVIDPCVVKCISTSLCLPFLQMAFILKNENQII